MLLINFSFKNFGCFRDEQTFTMKRTDSPGDGARNWGHPNVSTVAAIYGANASGKSRFLRALMFVADFVDGSYSRSTNGDTIRNDPFRLDGTHAEEPSAFFVEFVADDGIRYEYWFSVTSQEVTEEVLYAYWSNRPSLLFSRTTDGGEQSIEFGPSFKGAKRPIWNITRKNSLFLSAAAAAGSEILKPAFDALTMGLAFYNSSAYRSELSFIKSDYRQNSVRFKALSELMGYVDVGVTALRVEERKSGENDWLSPVVEAMVKKLDPEQAAELKSSLARDLNTSLLFEHGGEESAWFTSDEESDGTIAALSFMSVALKSLTTGGVTLVDELDESLHPLLVRELVDLFADPSVNPKQAQLVFTTHDESLMDEAGEDRLLHRDQVWLTQKGKDGAAELLALTQFKPRSGENFGRNYLRGLYGAVPTPTLHARVGEVVAQLIEDEKAEAELAGRPTGDGESNGEGKK